MSEERTAPAIQTEGAVYDENQIQVLEGLVCISGRRRTADYTI